MSAGSELNFLKMFSIQVICFFYTVFTAYLSENRLVVLTVFPFLFMESSFTLMKNRKNGKYTKLKTETHKANDSQK